MGINEWLSKNPGWAGLIFMVLGQITTPLYPLIWGTIKGLSDGAYGFRAAYLKLLLANLEAVAKDRSILFHGVLRTIAVNFTASGIAALVIAPPTESRLWTNKGDALADLVEMHFRLLLRLDIYGRLMLQALIVSGLSVLFLVWFYRDPERRINKASSELLTIMVRHGETGPSTNRTAQ